MKIRFTKMIADAVQDGLSDMTADQLAETIREAEKLTQKNCWWLEYRVRDAVVEAAQENLNCSKE